MAKENRLSGVELFKIIGILLIVISHVSQTLTTYNAYFNHYDYVVDTSRFYIRNIILNVIDQFGSIGNNIFFCCSTWFLVGKTASAKKKAFHLLCSVWVISVLYLIVYLCCGTESISKHLLIYSVFPTCFNNCWYITCYIIFLFIYPWLNRLISFITQQNHLRIVVFSSLLWVIADYFFSNMFFPSNLILWITVYFLIAYLKLYCPEIMKSKKVGMILLVVGIFGSVTQVVIRDYFGTFSEIASNMAFSNCCPFFILIAIGGLILSLRSDLKSKAINYISGLSLFVYLIHENLLFRTYTRPAIWQFIYTRFGYSHVLLWDLLYAVILFVLSVIVSAVYKETLQKAVTKISDKLYSSVVRLFAKVEQCLLKIK